MEYRCIMIKLAEVMVDILGRGLPQEWGCGPNAFKGLSDKPSTPMRLLHYPAQKEVNPEQFGGRLTATSAMSSMSLTWS